MSVTDDPQPRRTQHYSNLHLLNDTEDFLVEAKRETQIQDESGSWKRETVTDGARVMINDGVKIHPITMELNPTITMPEGNVVADPAGVPARSFLLQKFSTQWAAIAQFIDQVMAANGYYGED